MDQKEIDNIVTFLNALPTPPEEWQIKIAIAVLSGKRFMIKYPRRGLPAYYRRLLYETELRNANDKRKR